MILSHRSTIWLRNREIIDTFLKGDSLPRKRVGALRSCGIVCFTNEQNQRQTGGAIIRVISMSLRPAIECDIRDAVMNWQVATRRVLRSAVLFALNSSLLLIFSSLSVCPAIERSCRSIRAPGASISVCSCQSTRLPRLYSSLSPELPFTGRLFRHTIVPPIRSISPRICHSIESRLPLLSETSELVSVSFSCGLGG